MTFSGSYPMVETQLLSTQQAGPSSQTQQSGQPATIFPDRVITTPLDRQTFTSEGITVVLSLSQMDPSAILQVLNNAGIPCTIDRGGFLQLTGTDVIPTSSDPNVLIALGLVPGIELREDGGMELREDGGIELRQT